MLNVHLALDWKWYMYMDYDTFISRRSGHVQFLPCWHLRRCLLSTMWFEHLIDRNRVIRTCTVLLKLLNASLLITHTAFFYLAYLESEKLQSVALVSFLLALAAPKSQIGIPTKYRATAHPFDSLHLYHIVNSWKLVDILLKIGAITHKLGFPPGL